MPKENTPFNIYFRKGSSSGLCTISMKANELFQSKFFAGCCSNNAYFVRGDGSLNGFGVNTAHQFGLGEEAMVARLCVPTRIKFFDTFKVRSIACGELYTVFLMDNGAIYYCGYLFEDSPAPTPREMDFFSKQKISVNKIASGSKHVGFLTGKGELYAMGNNEHGQLGNSNEYFHDKPTVVGFEKPTKIVNFACGGNHTVCLASDYSIYTFGNNTFGQLGNGRSGEHSVTVPTKIKISCKETVSNVYCGATFTLCQSPKKVFFFGLLKGLGENVNKPKQLKTLQNKEIVSISCGRFNALFLTSEGDIFGMGSNEEFQLNTEKKGVFSKPVLSRRVYNERIVAIASGSRQSYFISADGKLFGLGSNEYNQLGVDKGDPIVDYPVFIADDLLVEDERYVKNGVGEELCQLLELLE